MKKALIERFINKYSLNDAIDAVTWVATPKGLSVTFISDDQNLAGSITSTEIIIPDGEYSIYETKTLKKLLGVLNDEIEVEPVIKNGKCAQLLFKDKSSKIIFPLAHAMNIPKAPKIRPITYSNRVIIDKEFIDKFSKAAAALSDNASFMIESDGTTTSVILGEDGAHSNKVILEAKVDLIEPLDPLNFHAKYMKLILANNKELAVGALEVAYEGARISFVADAYEINYYLTRMN